MNRTEKRKKKKLYSSKPTKMDNELSGMIKIFVGIVVVFLVFYFAYAIYNGELFKKKEKEEKAAPEFQDVEILAGSSFTIDRDDYIVLFYDFDSNHSGLLDVLRNGYESSTNAVKVYTVDLNKGFNKPYVVEKEEDLSKQPGNIDELKVVNYTLVRFQNDKAVEVISGVESIKNYFTNITVTE